LEGILGRVHRAILARFIQRWDKCDVRHIAGTVRACTLAP
jgi:hypothetical protein